MNRNLTPKRRPISPLWASYGLSVFMVVPQSMWHCTFPRCFLYIFQQTRWTTDIWVIAEPFDGWPRCGSGTVRHHIRIIIWGSIAWHKHNDPKEQDQSHCGLWHGLATEVHRKAVQQPVRSWCSGRKSDEQDNIIWGTTERLQDMYFLQA